MQRTLISKTVIICMIDIGFRV